MSESAFIGEAATRVVTDHMVKPEDIHNKYKTEVEALITALEREISITREDKVVARADSRGSSRTSSPVPNNNENHGKFTYISCMDPGHLDESVSLNDACKWILKFKKYMKSCHQYGYTLEQYIDQLDNRLDEYWQSHIGDMERFEYVTEIDAHFKESLKVSFPFIYAGLPTI